MFKLKMSRHISLISILRCAVPLAMLVGTPAWALYKVVGPDGKVTYTDRPPVDQNAVTLKSNGATSGTDNLPYDLKKVVDKYPVTLFTSSNCAPCDAGRRYLQARGVPFTEKTVSTDADIKALSKQESVNETPVLKVGTKQLLGFAQSEWASYLDAAGYPAQSRLPANYKQRGATPLTPAATPASAAASRAESTAPTSAPSPAPASGNAPAGFRF